MKKKDSKRSNNVIDLRGKTYEEKEAFMEKESKRPDVKAKLRRWEKTAYLSDKEQAVANQIVKSKNSDTLREPIELSRMNNNSKDSWNPGVSQYYAQKGILEPFSNKTGGKDPSPSRMKTDAKTKASMKDAPFQKVKTKIMKGL